ncbi:hypothetical protein BH10PAT3_BH10PAT3_7310 [soil metagenome]
MRKLLKPRFIILLAVFLILCAGIGLIVLKNNNKSDNRPDYRKAVNDFTVTEHSRIEKLAEGVKTVSDLKKLSKKDQADVGVLVIQQKITKKDMAGASTFAIELMKREDATGIDASKLCYKAALTVAAKNVCVARATELARKQGIIGPDETLPYTYFDQTGVQEQG